MRGRLETFIFHPLTNLAVGIYFMGSALSDITIKFHMDSERMMPGTHHGVFLLGLLIVIRCFAELVENDDSVEDSLEKTDEPRWHTLGFKRKPEESHSFFENN